MGKQSAEKYLDELLNSVNREEKHNELMEANKDFVMELQTAMSAGVGNDFAEIEASNPSTVLLASVIAEPLFHFDASVRNDDSTMTCVTVTLNDAVLPP